MAQGRSKKKRIRVKSQLNHEQNNLLTLHFIE